MPRSTVAQDIDIAPYDPGWLVAAEVLRRLFEGALSDLAASIEHVGSTAVPGLAAKPILDVDVILRADSDFPAATTRLAGLGYIHEGDLGVLGREAFKGPSGATPHHLYVCLPSGREHRRHLAFLDYLRNHPAETAGYAALKRRLAAAFPEDGPRMPRGRALSWKRFSGAGCAEGWRAVANARAASRGLRSRSRRLRAMWEEAGLGWLE